MRKVLIITIAAIYLIGNTEMAELFKLNNLLAHYFQHHRQNPDISFVDFLAEHYSGDDHVYPDHSQHKKLPFHNTIHNSFSSLVFCQAIESPSIEKPAFTKKVYTTALFVHYPGKHVNVLIQPPRYT